MTLNELRHRGDFERYNLLDGIEYYTEEDFTNSNNKPIKITEKEYQNYYAPHIVWKGKEDIKESNTVYSDRLIQWDYEKYNECCKSIWNNEGQYFNNREPEDIEKFLNLYFNKKVKLTAIMRGCNVSNDYPYWIFYYEK